MLLTWLRFRIEYNEKCINIIFGLILDFEDHPKIIQTGLHIPVNVYSFIQSGWTRNQVYILSFQYYFMDVCNIYCSVKHCPVC